MPIGHALNDSNRRARRFATLHRLLLFLLLLPGLAFASLHAAPVAAQELSPVTLEVTAGFDGRYRVNQWFPVTIIASNDGPDLQGVLEWEFVGVGNGPRFQHEIDLPRGARKRVTIYAYATNFARTGEVRLLAGDTAVALESLRVEPIDTSRFTVGVVSPDASLLNSLLTAQFGQSSGTDVLHIALERLPAHAAVLHSFDVLVLHNVDTAGLTPEQRAALGLWVHMGGQLVVGGGSEVARTTAGIADLLPVTVADLAGDVALDPLSRLLPGANDTSLPRTTVNLVQPAPGARALDPAQLLTARQFGSGRVVFVAFDLSVLRSWDDEPRLWEAVVEANSGFNPGLLFRFNGQNPLRSALQLPVLRLPPFWLLLLLVLAYIVVVGPLNFWLLRRLRRVELAWATIPAVVVVTVLALFAASMLVRGNKPQVVQFAVVQGFANHAQSQATAFIGVFSPQRATYDLSLSPPPALLSIGRFEVSADNDLVVQTDRGTELQNVLIDVSELRTFVAEQEVASLPQVEGIVERSSDQITVSVANGSSLALDDVLVVSGDSAVVLGALQPGGQQTVELDLAQGNFPSNTDVSSEGSFNRQRILDELFGFGQFGLAVGPSGPGMVDPQGVYLLGWHEQPTVDLQLDDAAVGQRGLTLYVIRLEG